MKTLMCFSLLILSIVPLQNSVACEFTAEELIVLLQAQPWEDYTHTHDTTNMPNHSGGSGTHTHEGTVRELRIGDCFASESRVDGHEVVEPDPATPVIEGYQEPILGVCISGPCLEKRPIQVLGPVDIHGNKPPDPEPGEPELFYPTIEIDGKNYWDSTRQPYQVSEEVENAETTPDGYKLEEIDGKLYLVPYEDTLKHTPVDPFFEDPAKQDTLIIYTLVKVIGGQNFLQATPFHARPVDDSTDDPVGTEIEPRAFEDTQDPPANTAGDNQDPQSSQGNQDSQDGQDSLGETFASLDGKYYQVTSNPAIPLQVTEYMVEGWANGQKKLPQWIEVYNPNTLAVNLVGYEFSYVFKKQTHAIQLRHFLIPPEGAVILATHIPRQRYRYEGISDAQVYNLDIENALRLGWSLKDSTGQMISEVGKAFGQKDAPVKPARVGLSRVSYNVYASEDPKTAYFFGFREDVSTPGFHDPPIPRSPALLRQKMRTTWASFKKHDKR